MLFERLVSVKHPEAFNVTRVKLFIIAEPFHFSDHAFASKMAYIVHGTKTTVIVVALITLVVHAGV
jgi:hypothetical protein